MQKRQGHEHFAFEGSLEHLRAPIPARSLDPKSLHVDSILWCSNILASGLLENVKVKRQCINRELVEASMSLQRCCEKSLWKKKCGQKVGRRSPRQSPTAEERDTNFQIRYPSGEGLER